MPSYKIDRLRALPGVVRQVPEAGDDVDDVPGASASRCRASLRSRRRSRRSRSSQIATGSFGRPLLVERRRIRVPLIRRVGRPISFDRADVFVAGSVDRCRCSHVLRHAVSPCRCADAGFDPHCAYNSSDMEQHICHHQAGRRRSAAYRAGSFSASRRRDSDSCHAAAAPVQRKPRASTPCTASGRFSRA